jgi:hypothetical protein
MEINNTSPLKEVLQAISGTWDLSTGDSWKVIELGKMRLFKRLVEKDRSSNSIALPDRLIKNREEVTPYLTFKKDTVSGGLINLQQTAIDLQSDEAMLVVIIQY